MDQLHDINLIYHFCSWSSSNCWNDCTLGNISLLRFLVLHVRQSKIVTQTVNSLSDSSTTSYVVKISSHICENKKRINSPKKLSEALNDFFWSKIKLTLMDWKGKVQVRLWIYSRCRLPFSTQFLDLHHLSFTHFSVAVCILCNALHTMHRILYMVYYPLHTKHCILSIAY